jgi:soluble lytic murein transglycosylase-like protein
LFTTRQTGPERGLPAKINLIAIGVIVGAASISGCTSTSQMKPAPSFTETATAAGADAGFTVPLPDTVSVLPESSGIAPIQTAALPIESAPQPVEPVAAFAGPTPLAATVPAAMAAKTAPAYVTAGLAVPVAVPVTGKTVAQPAMPGVQQVAYVVPQNPAALLDPAQPAEQPSTGGRSEVDRLIAKYAALYQVPVDLVRHVVNRESTFNPRAYNNGHWGLMQIKHATARGMGYDGPPKGLFDAETNLKYAVKYLRGAWLVANGNAKRADRLYQSGYYYDAKRKGLLDETGLGHDRMRHRLQPDA